MRVSVRAAAFGAAASVLFLTACGGVGGGGGDDDGAAGDGEPTGGSLETMGLGLGDEVAQVRHDMAAEAIAPFEVQVIEGGFDQQQFLSSVNSDNPPDMVTMDRQLVGTFAARGALMPLTDCVENADVDVSQYREPAVEEVTLDDTLYGLPEFYNNRIVLINNAVLEEAGLTPDDVDTSDWAALSDFAKATAVVDGGTVTRIGFDPKIPEFLPLWAKANGVDLLSEDGAEANIDDPAVVEALEYTVGLVEAQGGWGAFKSFRDSWDFFGAENQFAASQLGAFPMEDWYLNVLNENSPDVELTVKPFTGVDGQPVDFVTGSAWVIPAESDFPEQACEYIKTMTSSEAWIAAAEARAEAREAEGLAFTGVYTGNSVADETIFGELVNLEEGTYGPAVQAVLDAQEAAFSLPSSRASAEFQTAWQNAVNRVLAGEQEPAEALAQAQTEAQEALDAAAEG
jgi:multiple sugar transport system substrate-binding protein